jgi:SAM-dependent methyltransferase
VDRDTVAVYQEKAGEWRSRRGERGDGLGAEFRSTAGPGPVVDLGCGVGRYLTEIGAPVIGMDATAAMLREATHVLAESPSPPVLVRGDLEALPFAERTLVGLFARHSYLHLPKTSVLPALREARRVLVAGGLLFLSLIPGDYEGRSLPHDDFPGRYFALWSEAELEAVLAEAGFREARVETRERLGGRQPDLVGRARR